MPLPHLHVVMLLSDSNLGAGSERLVQVCRSLCTIDCAGNDVGKDKASSFVLPWMEERMMMATARIFTGIEL